MRLNEVLQRPYPWKPVLTTKEKCTSAFTTENGRYIVILNSKDAGSAELLFKLDGRIEMTNTGDAFRVLSTVGEISLEMIKQVRPRVFYFHAWEDEVSRVKLYHKLARIIASRANYTLHTETSSLSTRFFFRRGDIG